MHRKTPRFIILLTELKFRLVINIVLFLCTSPLNQYIHIKVSYIVIYSIIFHKLVHYRVFNRSSLLMGPPVAFAPPRPDRLPVDAFGQTAFVASRSRHSAFASRADLAAIVRSHQAATHHRHHLQAVCEVVGQRPLGDLQTN